MRREHGAEITNRIARHMVVPPHRDGGQSQYIEMPVPEPGTADELAGVLQWAVSHLDEPLSVEGLAARAAMSPRTFARRFRQRTGATPGWWGVTPGQYRRAFRLTEPGTSSPGSGVSQQAG